MFLWLDLVPNHNQFYHLPQGSGAPQKNVGVGNTKNKGAWDKQNLKKKINDNHAIFVRIFTLAFCEKKCQSETS